jgi:16S rRNA (uracil1498-N3)-methyltransferase
MRRRFFVDSFDANSATMRGSTAEHLGRVLRAEEGQLYELSDGRNVWLARIERVALSKRSENQIDFTLVEPVVVREPSLDLVLLVSLVKFDHFEWCLEKATELGVNEIIPLAAARTDKTLLAASWKRRERWERILLESAQQSRRLRAPVLRAPVLPADAFVHSSAACKLILSERHEAPFLREALSHSATLARPAAQSSAALAVGPEGGWTDGEIVAALSADFAEASLGENILRTETAVVASLAILRFALSAN